VLSRLAYDLVGRCGAGTILPTGTDLSSFYAEGAPDYPFLDLAQLDLDAIMEASLVRSKHAVTAPLRNTQ
jgi:hypothetical protein